MHSQAMWQRHHIDDNMHFGKTLDIRIGCVASGVVVCAMCAVCNACNCNFVTVEVSQIVN